MKKILNIGHCNFDGPRIKELLEDGIADLEVIEEKTQKAALKTLEREKWDLVLVNRVFDFDGYEGLKFIAEFKEKYPNKKIVLISNLVDSQKEAEKLGALKGFGKDDLGSKILINRIKKCLK